MTSEQIQRMVERAQARVQAAIHTRAAVARTVIGVHAVDLQTKADQRFEQARIAHRAGITRHFFNGDVVRGPQFARRLDALTQHLIAVRELHQAEQLRPPALTIRVDNKAAASAIAKIDREWRSLQADQAAKERAK